MLLVLFFASFFSSCGFLQDVGPYRVSRIPAVQTSCEADLALTSIKNVSTERERKTVISVIKSRPL